MSFLNNLRNALKEDLPEAWLPLQEEAQLQQIKMDSFEKPVVIFKHSTSCGISNMAKFQLESGWDLGSKDLDFYYLDLWKFRPISNEIVDYFDIAHQSPQMILIKDGAVVHATSHHGVHLSGLKTALAKVSSNA
jgi:bacillithiol system protein YtxJ